MFDLIFPSFKTAWPAGLTPMHGHGSVLYITADMYLLPVQTKTKGLGF